MSKIVVSEIEGFRGRVTLKEPLFFDDVFAIENALDRSAEVEPSEFWAKMQKRNPPADGQESEELTWTSKTDRFFIEAILQCSEKFEIEGMDEKPTLANFPMNPRPKARQFVQLLWDELDKIYNGEAKIPNGS